MVRIRSPVSKEGLAAIMIDGYAPEPDEFEALPWQEMWKEGILTYSEWLNRIRPHQRNIKKRYSESSYLTAYRNAIRAVMRGFCPIKKSGVESSFMQPAYPEPVCFYRGFTTEHISGSIETPYQHPVISKTLLKTHLAKLQREYRADEHYGNSHYIQNVIMYPHSSKANCSKIDECHTKWIKTLDFKEKTHDSYLDLEQFTSSWLGLLADMTHVKPGRWFRLYDELGLSYEE